MSRKDAMVQKAEARLDQVNAEVDRLKAKAVEAQADARLEIERELEDVQSRRETFEERVAEIRDAGEDALSDLADGFERAWTSLSAALRSATSRFS